MATLQHLSARVLLLLLTLFTALGCGNSSEEFVYSGNTPQRSTSGTNEVLLSVSVPGNVSGARLLDTSVTPGTVRVRTLAGAESPPVANGDYTLPGALCRAYDTQGLTRATVVVNGEGNVRFDRLPSGVYRFVVTNQDAAVVLEIIARISPGGPTFIDANTSSTAAVLVALAAGKGNFDFDTYINATAADLTELISMVEIQVANPGDPWITPDGKTVVDPAVKTAVDAAVLSLPGLGEYVHGGETPEALRAATPGAGGQNAAGPPPYGQPASTPDGELPTEADPATTTPGGQPLADEASTTDELTDPEAFNLAPETLQVEVDDDEPLAVPSPQAPTSHPQ